MHDTAILLDSRDRLPAHERNIPLDSEMAPGLESLSFGVPSLPARPTDPDHGSRRRMRLIARLSDSLSPESTAMKVPGSASIVAV